MPSTPATRLRWLLAPLVACGHTAQPPTPGTTTLTIDRTITLQPSARVPEDDANLSGEAVGSDAVVLRFTAPPAEPPFVGEVVVGAAYGGYLRRVVQVSAPTPTEFTLATAPAQLTDLIADGAFTVIASSSTAQWAQNVSSGPNPASGPRLAPAVETELDLFPSKESACSVGLQAEFELTPTLSLSSPVLTTQIDIGPSGLNSATFELQSSLDMGLEVGALAGIHGTCSLDLGDKLPNWTVYEVIPIPAGPIVVPIPLQYTLAPELKLTATLATERATGTTIDISAQGALQAGVRYVDGAWTAITPTLTPSLTVEPDEKLPKASVALSATVAGKLSVLIADVAGPYVEAGLEGEGMLTTDLCNWNATLAANVLLEAGGSASLPVVGNLATLAISTKIPLAELQRSEPIPGCLSCNGTACDADEICLSCDGESQCLPSGSTCCGSGGVCTPAQTCESQSASPFCCGPCDADQTCSPCGCLNTAGSDAQQCCTAVFPPVVEAAGEPCCATHLRCQPGEYFAPAVGLDPPDQCCKMGTQNPFNCTGQYVRFLEANPTGGVDDYDCDPAPLNFDVCVTDDFKLCEP